MLHALKAHSTKSTVAQPHDGAEVCDGRMVAALHMASASSVVQLSQRLRHIMHNLFHPCHICGGMSCPLLLKSQEWHV
jgi:hypothetical protein